MYWSIIKRQNTIITNFNIREKYMLYYEKKINKLFYKRGALS